MYIVLLMDTSTHLICKLLLTTLLVAVGILTADTALAASREPRPEASACLEVLCMRCYLESDTCEGTAVHLSISMEFNSEDSVASGDYDHLIRELAAFLQEFSHVPFYIRIGYEFDGFWPGDEYVDWIGYSFWYNEPVKQWWVKKMAEPGYLHGPEGLYKAIGFEPGR